MNASSYSALKWSRAQPTGDSHGTIVVAVEEARRIFNNIRKFIRYILTCNSAEIWTILLVQVLGEVDPDFETRG